VLVIFRLVLELANLSKVKCLVYYEMCECTYSFIQRKNLVRTIIFGFIFCSVLYGVGFVSVSYTFFTFEYRFGSVLAKPGFWFGLFLPGLGSFPSLILNLSYVQSLESVLFLTLTC